MLDNWILIENKGGDGSYFPLCDDPFAYVLPLVVNSNEYVYIGGDIRI